MAERDRGRERRVQAVHGRKKIKPDSAYVIGMGRYLRQNYGREDLLELYSRFAGGLGEFDALMRNIVCRALVKQFGNSVDIAAGVSFKHPETFSIGNGVFLGTGTFIQGWYDGKCTIGDYVWIGPHSYFDARILVIEDYVGWGPGAKVLGCAHTGRPADVPVVKTDLIIKPVRIGRWADIGVNAVIMPGVTVGQGSIVGAGAVVTEDVEPFTVVAGVPARVLRKRERATRRSRNK